jgi:hypothetical protein
METVEPVAGVHLDNVYEGRSRRTWNLPLEWLDILMTSLPLLHSVCENSSLTSLSLHGTFPRRNINVYIEIFSEIAENVFIFCIEISRK